MICFVTAKAPHASHFSPLGSSLMQKIGCCLFVSFSLTVSFEFVLSPNTCELPLFSFFTEATEFTGSCFSCLPFVPSLSTSENGIPALRFLSSFGFMGWVFFFGVGKAGKSGKPLVTLCASTSFAV